jgi:hypothetical protein
MVSYVFCNDSRELVPCGDNRISVKTKVIYMTGG